MAGMGHSLMKMVSLLILCLLQWKMHHRKQYRLPLVLVFERNIYCITYEVLRCLLLSVLLIPSINLSVLIKQEKGTFLTCVVFLCITVTHGSDGNPLTFDTARIIDTTVGIVIALVINRFLFCRSKEPPHIE